MLFSPVSCRHWKILALLILFFPLLLAGNAVSAPNAASCLYRDDLHYAGLASAIEQSLHYLNKRPATACFPLSGTAISRNDLIRSLRFFRDLIRSKPSPQLLSLELETYFDFHHAPPGPCLDNAPKNTLITGYYQPVFAGSLTRTPPYLYPIYEIPDNLVRKWNPKTHTLETGRLQDGQFVPYWTRAEIELHNRAKGFELVYLRDPFDAFLLHIQGSGLIRLRDGTLRSIHYALKNGRPYRSIGKYMVRTGRLEKNNTGLAAIRDYLARHPGERQKILHYNQSFIFFKWSNQKTAQGNLGLPLTPHRSIAVDQRVFPAGGLAFLQSDKPVPGNSQPMKMVSFSRFVLVQDTGSAITGPKRADLFWGTGDDAGRAAGRMKEPGNLFFLLLKKKFL